MLVNIPISLSLTFSFLLYSSLSLSLSLSLVNVTFRLERRIQTSVNLNSILAMQASFLAIDSRVVPLSLSLSFSRYFFLSYWLPHWVIHSMFACVSHFVLVLYYLFILREVELMFCFHCVCYKLPVNKVTLTVLRVLYLSEWFDR